MPSSHLLLTNDYCNKMLARSPMSTTNRLQWMLNAAAHVVSDTGKFDLGLVQLRHPELHWVDTTVCIQCKLGKTAHRCLQSRAPRYLVDCCTPTLLYFLCRQQSASSLCQPLPAHPFTTSLHQVRSSGIFCCRPDDLELSA